MKTSLICLLLLAAVACAAPEAGKMPGEKRVGMAGKMWEKTAEKRKEVVEIMRKRAEEKRKEAENPVADAKSDVESESRSERCNGPCFEVEGEYLGCSLDSCVRNDDEIDFDESTGCACCADGHAPYDCPE